MVPLLHVLQSQLADRQRLLQLPDLLLGRRQVQDDHLKVLLQMGMLSGRASDVIADDDGRRRNERRQRQSSSDDCDGKTGEMSLKC